MIELKSTLHANISPSEIEEIIRIKSLSWKYSFNEHKIWIKNHLKNVDIHLMLLEGASLIAYMNLITLELMINSVLTKAVGVGNVCTKQRGKGYGSQLMEASNRFLVGEDMLGLLFCKPALINFYHSSGWELVDKKILKLDFEISNIEVMIFNYKNEVTQLEYRGNIF